MKSSDLIEELKAEGIHNSRVLDAIAKVPREKFVPKDLADLAYENEALPIECRQTISQPYVVARMTDLLLGNESMQKVLEVGTGSGYQAAVLAQLVDEVFTIERFHSLYATAQQRLMELGYKNIHCAHGDGSLGWPNQAPFDGIIVTAASPDVPNELREQLVDGGRMVIPVGMEFGAQELVVITRIGNRFEYQRFEAVVFVPLLHGKVDE